MSAAWAGVLVAALMAMAAIGGWIFRAGRREGKIDQLLAELVEANRQRREWQASHDLAHASAGVLDHPQHRHRKGLNGRGS